MSRTDWVNQLLATIDTMDADGFANFLAENVSFRFGNAEPIIGKAATRNAVDGFFRSIGGTLGMTVLGVVFNHRSIGLLDKEFFPQIQVMPGIQTGPFGEPALLSEPSILPVWVVKLSWG